MLFAHEWPILRQRTTDGQPASRLDELLSWTSNTKASYVQPIDAYLVWTICFAVAAFSLGSRLEFFSRAPAFAKCVALISIKGCHPSQLLRQLFKAHLSWI
jgi:hypothetical protein